VNKTRVITAVSLFSRNFEDIADNPGELSPGFSRTYHAHSCQLLTNLKVPACSTSFQAAGKPHRLRVAAENRRVLSVPIIIFMDDVSGNISKQWNKHYVVYMSNANMPREMLEREFCVRFVTSSPHVAPMELMRAVKESITYVFFFTV
jgi:hypothetical protein